jgi:hypothetical protein
MTARDRLVLCGVVVLAVLAAGWLLVVSPERQQAAQVLTQVQSARQQLASAQAQASEARSAEQRYATAYVSVVSLGKAVPPSSEVPSLIYELDQASHEREVDFSSIATSTSGSAPSSTPPPSSSSSSSSSSSATPAGFTQLPFTFVFKGSFAGLAHLMGEVEGLVRRTSSGGVQVNGRLLTIQGADVAIENNSQSTRPGGVLSATITATAYVLPAGQGLTAGVTPVGPGASGSASSSSLPTTPAVVRAAP